MDVGSAWSTSRKRRKGGTGNAVSVQTPVRHESESEGFLKKFDESNPIAVIVTPLRRSQGRVLQRNLERASARVFSSVEELQHLEDGGTKNVIVVTDNRQKAHKKLPPSFRDARKSDVSFVSTKWASSLLSSQQYVPYNDFLLPDELSPISLSTDIEKLEPKAIAKSTVCSSHCNRPNTLPLYVWCGEGLTAVSDLNERRALLCRIPELQCERSTFSKNVLTTPNDELCALLSDIGRKRMLESVQLQDGEMRARAYHRASAALKCVPFPLQSVDEAVCVSGIGPSALSAILEYLQSGGITEAKHLTIMPRLRALNELSHVYGVGLKTACRFHDVEGISSTSHLRSRLSQDPPNGLTKTCIKFLQWEPRLTKARRDIVFQFRDKVMSVANAEPSLAVQIMICGGLRRGELAGHDADFVYCRREGNEQSNTDSIMHLLTSRLTDAGLLRVILHESSDAHGWGEVRYFGRGQNDNKQELKCKYAFAHDVTHAIAELNGEYFRVDFVGVRDADEMCFATLAWSGSTGFQRDIRIVAERRGWVFNDHGIFDRFSGERIPLTSKPRTEMDVFAALGLTYRPPFERCS